MSIETLTAEVGHLRDDFDEHKAEDKKNFKYAHNMLEDLLTKSARLDETVGHLKNERVNATKEELSVRVILADVTARLQTIERLAWALLLGLLGILGSQLLKLLG